MTYTSIFFLLFVFFVGLLYFTFPSFLRCYILTVASLFFIVAAGGWSSFLYILGTVCLVWILSVFLPKAKYKKILYILGMAGVLILLFIFKYFNFCYSLFFTENEFSHFSVIAPIGIAFYSLQLISYLSDIYHGKIEPQKNIVKFVLFVIWFPHILQGPIERYGTMEKSLYEGKGFDWNRVTMGCQLLLWGIAKKLIIADRAYVIVSEVYSNTAKYGSIEIIFASVLYGFELFADFSGCVDISRGVSEIFGIEIAKNFEQPYLAISIKDFWRRWHISLSTWLRDYVYIPLGGNRKGKLRKNINLMTTFLVSGIWHGVGFQFLIWGGLHGVYQIIGELTYNIRSKIKSIFHINMESKVIYIITVAMTFIWVDLAWIFFRADSVPHALQLIRYIFIRFNPWVLFNGSLYNLGLDNKEFWLLLFAIIGMMLVDKLHEKGIEIRKTIAGYPIVSKWILYFMLIFGIIIFGKYGYGFNATDFIYMQF